MARILTIFTFFCSQGFRNIPYSRFPSWSAMTMVKYLRSIPTKLRAVTVEHRLPHTPRSLLRYIMATLICIALYKRILHSTTSDSKLWPPCTCIGGAQYRKRPFRRSFIKYASHRLFISCIAHTDIALTTYIIYSMSLLLDAPVRFTGHISQWAMGHLVSARHFASVILFPVSVIHSP